MRPDPDDDRSRFPWGTAGVVAGAATAGWTAAPWWASVPVPRAPHPLPGAAVPVTGPAARDADGDGVPDTLVIDGLDGPVLWTDLDGDGLADTASSTSGDGPLGVLTDRAGW
ncbi:DUF6802 family protein [Pseudonocardia nematodicida]|uniref:DUF6802 family protein n=1 Tax=Pseudonocardia nematodicida TaxID=1206997 RepID=A0ABV1KL18_9PSEU